MEDEIGCVDECEESEQGDVSVLVGAVHGCEGCYCEVKEHNGRQAKSELSSNMCRRRVAVVGAGWEGWFCLGHFV